MQLSERKRGIGSQRGFTLLEILVAILIFGIVMSSLFISFRSLLFEPAEIQQVLGREQMARSALDRIASDLQVLHVALPPHYRPPGFNDPPSPDRFFGEVDFQVDRQFSRLRFTSMAHLPMRDSPRKGIAQIVYYVEAAADDGYVLRRADHLEPYPDLEELSGDPVLCEDVETLRIGFLDDEGEIFETWDSDAEDLGYAVPKSVALRLELVGRETPDVFETQVVLPVQREIAN